MTCEECGVRLDSRSTQAVESNEIHQFCSDLCVVDWRWNNRPKEAA